MSLPDDVPTLWDLYCAAAVMGFCSSRQVMQEVYQNNVSVAADGIARLAREVADAAMAERAKRTEEPT